MPVTFQAICSGAASWSIEGEAVEDDGSGNYAEVFEPIPEGFIDHYLPTIESGGVSYTLGENHQNWDQYHGSIAWADSITELSNFDPGRVIGTNGATVYTNFRPLAMTNGYKYNYGTMEITSGGQTYYCRGVRQFFERPMAPLYVDNITIPAISYASQMFAENAAIRLTIYAVESGSTVLGQPLYTMTCGASDVVNQGTVSVSGKTVKTGTLVFKRNSTADELILTDAFAIEIEGFQDEGVDVGLAAALIDPCDQTLCKGASMTLLNEERSEIDATLTFNTRVPCISIGGMYDGIKLLTTSDNLTLVAPEEGGACKTKESGQTIVSVKTAIAWKYDSKSPNYVIEGLPSWLNVKVDESQRYFINGSTYGKGLVKLSFEAEPLPEDENYRSAELFIKGKGVSSDLPIVITQSRIDKSSEKALLEEMQNQLGLAEDSYNTLVEWESQLSDKYKENHSLAEQLLSEISKLEEELQFDERLNDDEKLQLGEDIMQLQKRVEELNGENEAINNELSAFSEGITMANELLNTQRSAMTKLTAELETADNITELEEIAEKLKSANSNVQDAANSLDDAMGAYFTREGLLNDIGEDLNEVLTDLDKIKERIKDIALGIGMVSQNYLKTQVVYSVTGNKVREKATSIDNLPAGVYIMGNRKVLVK